MKVKVKICGIQTHEDAVAAIAAGADMLGFIFVRDSKRAIDFEEAKNIVKKVKGKTLTVGVFKDNTLEEVKSFCKEIVFDLVQLHGQEDQYFCEQVSRPVIKSFGLVSDFDITHTTQKLTKYNVAHYLIDRQSPGEGEMLSLEKAAHLAKIFPLFFAGGLTPKNVADIVTRVKPFAVDVISGVKTNGKFDFEKMKRFVANAKGVTL